MACPPADSTPSASCATCGITPWTGLQHHTFDLEEFTVNWNGNWRHKHTLPCSVVWHSAMLAAFAVIVSSGCGSNSPKTVPVTGKISYNGQPLSSGTVMLIPETADGYGATGQILEDGTFKLTSFKPNDGAAPGTYKVTVQVFPDEEAGGEELGLPGAEFGVGKKPPIPLGYGDPATTKLSALINDGETELDLKLED